MAGPVNILSPVGRIVRGDLYKANTTDQDGKPLVVKTGANAGQPRSNFFFALAIPKGPEKHWAETPWGQKIWAVGHAAHPQAAQSPQYAWKVEDGDSTVANLKGNRPCDNEGYKGNWIIRFSGGFAPKVYKQEGPGWVQIMETDAVKPGSYIEVNFNVDGNTGPTPGVYLNYQGVCFRGYGPEISYGISASEMGFGQAPLPPGASAVPLASSAPPPALGAPSAPAPASAPPPPAPVADASASWQRSPDGQYKLNPATNAWEANTAPATPPPPAPIVVLPNTGFLQVPPPVPITGVSASAAGIPAIPTQAAPPPPTATASPSSGPQMTAAANGVSYESYKKANWTDDQLVAAGFMTR